MDQTNSTSREDRSFGDIGSHGYRGSPRLHRPCNTSCKVTTICWYPSLYQYSANSFQAKNMFVCYVFMIHLKMKIFSPEQLKISRERYFNAPLLLVPLNVNCEF